MHYCLFFIRIFISIFKIIKNSFFGGISKLLKLNSLKYILVEIGSFWQICADSIAMGWLVACLHLNGKNKHPNS